MFWYDDLYSMIVYKSQGCGCFYIMPYYYLKKKNTVVFELDAVNTISRWEAVLL